MNVETRNETMVRLVETLGGVIENRHTGIKTMIDEMKKANLPEVELKNEREDFVVTFYNGEYPELYPETIKSNMQDNNKNVPLNVPLNLIEQKIIEILRTNSSTTQKELAEKIGVTDKTIKRDINKLKEKGIIERIGARKNGYWKINI